MTPIEKKLAAAQTRIDKKLADAEERIGAARAEAMTEVEAVAADAAQDIVRFPRPVRAYAVPPERREGLRRVPFYPLRQLCENPRFSGRRHAVARCWSAQVVMVVSAKHQRPREQFAAHGPRVGSR